MAQSDASARPSPFIAIASIGVIVAGLYFAREVLVPIAVALLLTFLLTPLVHRLEHLRIPRIPAVLISVALSFSVIGGIGWLISDQARDLAVKIGSYQGDIERKIQNLHQSFGRGAFATAGRAIGEMAKDVATSQPADNASAPSWLNRGTVQNPVAVQITYAAEASSTFDAIANSLQFVAPMGQSVIVIVFMVFMLLQREDIRDRVIRLLGHGRLSVTTRALDDAATRISRYLLAQSAVNGVVGIVIGTGLYIIGVPNAPLWGLLCALLRFIPYLGIWIGAIFPIILSMVVPDGYYAARPLLTISLFVLTEILAANVAEPLLFSGSTGVSPLAILVAAVFWTWLWGGVGLLLSTPLTVLLVVAGKHVPRLQFLDVLLGDQPVLAPPERYYQRLLAEDPEEAEDLLEEFEKTRTPDLILSEIMLPALQMTERDHTRGVLDDGQRESIEQVIKDQVEALQHLSVRGLPSEKSAPVVPKDYPVRILCLPAQGLADEIAGLMLVNLLNQQGYCASAVSAETLASERVDAITANKADLVVISAMPPGALAHARYLGKRVRGKFPEIRVLIAIWNARGNTQRLKTRLQCDSSNQLVTQLQEALSTIHQMVQPLLIADRAAAADSPPLKSQTASSG